MQATAVLSVVPPLVALVLALLHHSASTSVFAGRHYLLFCVVMYACGTAAINGRTGRFIVELVRAGCP